MQRLLTALAIRRERTAFPGSVRLVAAPGREGLMADAGWPVEWPGADSAETIAGLGGVAKWETARGGLAVALISGSQLADGTAMPALVTSAQIGTPCVLAVVEPDASHRAIVAAAGWTWADAGFDTVTGPMVVAVNAAAAQSPIPITRGRYVPLRLLALRDWLTRTETDPLTDLASLGVAEPRLLLPHLTAPWKEMQPTAALLTALSIASGEGRRVCWHVPQSLDLRDCAPALRRIAERGRAMTLVVDHFDTTSLGFWSTLPGWWLAVAADVGEFRALLARAVGSDDLMVVARPKTSVCAPWPVGTVHEAGAGRWLAQESSARATIVCAGGLAGEAMRAHEALAAMGVPAAVFHVTSLQPLPEHDLIMAAEHGPLVVVDDGDPALGLAGAIARIGISVVPVGHHPLAADIAAAVRATPK